MDGLINVIKNRIRDSEKKRYVLVHGWPWRGDAKQWKQVTGNIDMHEME